MPNLPPISIPADAAAKAEEKGKGIDFYADMSDEEREEEGLPPREKPEPEKAEPEKKDAELGDDLEDEDDEDDADYDERLLREVAGLREDLSASLGQPETARKAKEAEDPLLAAALDHDDEVVRGLGERLQKAEQRLEAHEKQVREARTEAQLAKDDADFDAVQANYSIDGDPMTDKHVEQVEKYILQHPEVGAALTIEQLTRVVFPSATKRAKPSPAHKGTGGSPNGNGSPVATIVDEGATGGASPEPWTPRPNDTIESAIQAAGKRFGWKR